MGESHWIVWRKELTEDEVRRRYFEMTGREPDRIHNDQLKEVI